MLLCCAFTHKETEELLGHWSLRSVPGAMLDSGDAVRNRIDIVLVAWRLGSGDMELTELVTEWWMV